jgi:hypothetical protein
MFCCRTQRVQSSIRQTLSDSTEMASQVYVKTTFPESSWSGILENMKSYSQSMKCERPTQSVIDWNESQNEHCEFDTVAARFWSGWLDKCTLRNATINVWRHGNPVSSMVLSSALSSWPIFVGKLRIPPYSLDISWFKRFRWHVLKSKTRETKCFDMKTVQWSIVGLFHRNWCWLWKSNQMIESDCSWSHMDCGHFIHEMIKFFDRSSECWSSAKKPQQRVTCQKKEATEMVQLDVPSGMCLCSRISVNIFVFWYRLEKTLSLRAKRAVMWSWPPRRFRVLW